ncbi:DUF2779 domain-containing protein [uncultured Methanobrevibacter sp.]|uniref:DUF2779 domain-containing protein n=1 Tax=uncultured Methanobrevibacter sp. TaxID=253161 RepID=UPI0025FD22C8|nr:DUF2779 domain-containing protein [uncultured Methanobrevibacter sp.]
MHLSKSRYCEGVQCEKILWLNEHGQDTVDDKGSEAILETGRKVGELAKGLFGDYEDVDYDNNIDVRIEKTRKLLKDGSNVIAEASFAFNNNFCSVDILKNDADGVEIYEVKSSTEIKEIYLDDISYQYFVLTNAGLNVKKTAIVYINNEYVRGSELDMAQLFNIEDVIDIVRQKQDEIRSNISRFTDLGQNEPDIDIGPHCFDPYPCSYWQHCTGDLPTPNVFDIAVMQRRSKFKKYYEGKISFEDLENENLNPKYLEQIDFELHDREPKIIKSAIDDVLNSLKYPLYFIDYETCQHAIPEIEGTKPYQQIPFQYSLHIIEKEGSPLEHKEFLAEADDDNLIGNFAKSMIADMPEDGSVIVYNKAFEATRNREIAEMYPEFKEDMGRFNANMVDLMVPFRERNYYTRQMQGSYSIKKVLPALFPDDPELDYNELSLVHKGDEASNAFLNLKDKNPEEQKPIRKALLDYCRLDTLAMVKIWEKFRQVTDDV